MQQRILLHIGFWLAYLLLNGYLEIAFAGSSFRDYPVWQRVVIGLATELFMLPAKIAAVYIVLYRVIPRYLLQKRYIRLGSESLLVILLFALVNLGSLYFLIYPIIYHESPGEGDFSIARIFWSLLDVTSVVGLATAFKLLRMRLESAEREKQLIEEKLQSELQFLRAQTNPHFLFNTLNNIYALARKKSDQTADVVLKLSKLMRFMLYECTKLEIPLADELKVIKDYIELEKIRYNNRLQVNYQEELDDASQAIAPLLLLPFVENAFKHGTSETRFETTISIQVILQNGKLDFYIQNSKDVETEVGPEGIGLRNVKRQLELLYPNQHELLVADKGTDFKVQLIILVPRSSLPVGRHGGTRKIQSIPEEQAIFQKNVTP